MASGSVYQRVVKGKKQKTWTITYDLPPDEFGTRKQKQKGGFKTQKLAQAELTKILATINDGQYVEPSKMTLTAFLDHWYEVYAKTNVQPSTLQGYRGKIREMKKSELANIRLDKLNPIHFQLFYKKKLDAGVSGTTMRHYHIILKGALNRGVAWGFLSANPLDKVDAPRESKHLVQAMTREEAFQLLAATKDHYMYEIIYLALFTGMRRSELLGLRWVDVDFERLVIQVVQTCQRINGVGVILSQSTKTDNSQRSIAISKTDVQLLKRLKAKQAQQRLSVGSLYEDHDLVFAQGDGTPYEPNLISHRFINLMKKMKLKYRFHDLRHTHASWLLAANEHPKVVSERLGHSSISMTLDTYSHLMPNMQRNAADKLDGILGDISMA